MTRQTSGLLSKLSTSDLKRLLAARERIDVLEEKRDQLRAALDKVEAELMRLVESTRGIGDSPARKKPGRPKGSLNKKASRKKVVRRKAASVAAAGKKKTARKSPARKAPARKATAKAAPRKAGGRVKLEDVIVKVIRKQGGPVAYKDLFSVIVKGKLFASKSGNFDNVMRRTLSTSKLVKRVGRGVYDVA